MTRIFTQEHKDKISKACKGRDVWSKGKTMPKDSLYKNMLGHLRYKVSLEWLESFDDIEKLKFLNRSIVRDRDKIGFNDNIYIAFIEKFYHDKQFNSLYSKWLASGKDKWMRPSLDHINPKSKKGSIADINNLQFLSWLENRTKVDMEQSEWNKIKQRIKEYFV